MYFWVSLHYAVKSFFTHSEKLIRSLSKNGQGKSMSIFQKPAYKFGSPFSDNSILLQISNKKRWIPCIFIRIREADCPGSPFPQKCSMK
jgi:hypothetical protein